MSQTAVSQCDVSHLLFHNQCNEGIITVINI